MLLLLLVEYFLRRSPKPGPHMLTSTKGRNIPVVFHNKLLAAITKIGLVFQIYLRRKQLDHSKALWPTELYSAISSCDRTKKC